MSHEAAPLPSAPSVPAGDLRPALPRHLSAVLTGLGLGLVLAGALLWGRPLNAQVFLVINAWGPAAPLLWSMLSLAGLGGAVWIHVGATSWGRPRRVAALLWVIVVGGALVHLLKHRLATPRPLGVLGADQVHVIGQALNTQSMPSGHSAMGLALAVLMLVDGGLGTPRARLQAALWGLLGLGIALSRPAVGAHWPSDVLFGGGLGVLAALIAGRAWGVNALARRIDSVAGRRVMAAVFVVSGLVFAFTRTENPSAHLLQVALGALGVYGARRWWHSAGVKAREQAATQAAAAGPDA